ncbi:MAG TPA: twin-arginine translocase subunit TatC [Acidimicrobiia bacterium]|nr:twin-arginine translocase subunit TatC [Acidimicrobiia bacterium]
MKTDQPQSILTHLNELRSRIIKVAVAILVGSIVAFLFADQLTEVLERPYFAANPDNQLQSLEAAEQLGVLMRVAFFGGLILASPVVFYQLWAFISPALTSRERKWVIPLIGVFVLLFVGGVLFGYSLLPTALEVLLGIFDGVRTDLRIGSYYSFVIRLLLAFGVTFQFPVFLFGAAAAGLVNSQQLSKQRRWAVLIIVIVAALVTPTGDPYTLLAMSLPLYLLYELTIGAIKLFLRK